MNKIPWGYVTLTSWILVVAAIVYGAYQVNAIYQDVDGWQVLAQTASNPAKMSAYMSKVEAGLEKWNMTSGYSDWPASPTNNMAQKYQAVKDVIFELEKMQQSGSWTQADLDGIANRIKAIDLQTWSYWFCYQGWWLPPLISFLFTIAFVTLLIWLIVTNPLLKT